MRIRDFTKQKKMRWYNKRLVQENTLALNMLRDFCMEGVDCWPVKVFATCILISHFIMTGSMVYVTSDLYTDKMSSMKFYEGGGVAMITSGAIGLLGGLTFSLVKRYPMVKLMVLSGSMMTLGISICILGSRGVTAGCYGGCTGGLVLGTLYRNDITVGGIVGLVLGGAVGAVPLLWFMDCNQRYIQYNYNMPVETEEGLEPDLHRLLEE